MEAYCVKCKEKREMLDPIPVYTDSARAGTRGQCSVCSTNMFRMGATPAHEGIEKPKPKPKKKESKKKVAKKSRTKRTSSKKAPYSGPRKGKLVIVESPAKARTVGRYMGRGYTVKASVGHIRDLYKSKLSVDIEHDFEPDLHRSQR
jgi:DNA topoisomerase-1